LIEAHRRKMATPAAKDLYRLRRQTVEASFGDAKQHRNYRRVHGRGLSKAKSQTALTGAPRKAAIFSGCKSHPATFAPAGSNRSGEGGNELVEASGAKGRKAARRASRP
jgi:hypothetical protein